MAIGIIGAGGIGQALTTQFVGAGVELGMIGVEHELALFSPGLSEFFQQFPS